MAIGISSTVNDRKTMTTAVVTVGKNWGWHKNFWCDCQYAAGLQCYVWVKICCSLSFVRSLACLHKTSLSSYPSWSSLITVFPYRWLPADWYNNTALKHVYIHIHTSNLCLFVFSFLALWQRSWISIAEAIKIPKKQGCYEHYAHSQQCPTQM